MSALMIVVLAFLLMVFVVGVVGVVVTVRAIRWLRLTLFGRIKVGRTSGRRASAQAPSRRRGRPSLATVDTLTALIVNPTMLLPASLPGRDRSSSRVSRDLHRDVVETNRVLQVARRSGRPVSDLESAVAKLAGHATELHVDLRTIAAERDPRERARLLAAHAERADLIRDSCADVRASLLQRGSATSEAALRRLVTDIKDAVTAARLREQAYRELSRP